MSAIEKDFAGLSGQNDTILPSSEAKALLLDLEELLLQTRSLGRASYRRRLEIEAEISAIHRDLARLGYEPSQLKTLTGNGKVK